MACVAIGCKNRMGNKAKISFHRFPKEPDIRNKWIENLRRANWTPSLYSRLCSLHFTKSCYRAGYNQKILHSDAVPTIFLGHSLQLKFSTRSAPLRTEILKSSSSNAKNIVHEDFIQMKSTISHQNKIIKKLKTVLLRYKRTATRRGKNLKNMRQKFYRQKKKLASTEIILNDLKNKLKLDDKKIDTLTTVAGKNNELLERMSLKEMNVSVPREYSTELKQFAVTLHFLSPMAYEYVRQHFNTALPHVKTIGRWYQGDD